MAIDPQLVLDAGEIYWVKLPFQGGSEQAGRRPCIVMSRRILNTTRTVVVVPMSAHIERANDFKIAIPVSEIIKDVNCTSEIKPSVALCHQVRAVDKAAMEGRIGKLSQNAILAVQLGLTFLFDIR